MNCFDCGNGPCHMNCGPAIPKRSLPIMATIDIECRFCWGAGKIHNRNGDPWDKGRDCPKCEGAGVVQEDANDFVPQFEDDE